MQTTIDQSGPKGLSHTTHDFREWRASRRRGARIPPHLWRSAVSLAVEHGVSRVSTALGLDYYALKKRLGVELGEAQEPKTAVVTDPDPVAQFVEIALPVESATVACTIEVERRDHERDPHKLRLEVRCIASSELGALVQALWNVSA